MKKDGPLERDLHDTEAATKTIFDYISYFLRGAPFSGLFQELSEFTKQIVIFKEGLSARRTDTIFFQEGMSFHRTHTDLPGGLFWLANRYRFSWKPFSSIFGQIGNQGRYPPPNRYFSNRSRWLLSTISSQNSESTVTHKVA